MGLSSGKPSTPDDVMKPFYLDGRWEGSANTVAVFNPWNGAMIDEVAVADAAQVEIALASAHRAFGRSRKVPTAERSEILARVAAGLKVRRQEFIDLIVAEAGKPLSFAEGEVTRAQLTFEFAAHEAVMAQGHMLELEATPPGRDHFGFVRRFPLGVILGITPFNFPLNLVAHKIAPCLATGNTMVLKPALKTPLTALLLAEVLHEAGVPAGQINIVPFGHEHIPPLFEDRRLKMLSFTGSAGVGWKLKSAAVRMKVALELGGNAGVIVEPDADLGTVLPPVVSGAFGYAGQSCISVQRIFVHEAIYREFRENLVSDVLHVGTGDPADPQTVVGPMISAAARDKVLRWIEEARSAGAKLLTPLLCEGQSVLHPILLEDVPPSCAVMAEEAFAPLAVLERYSDFEEALRKINDSVFGLQAGVFTSDLGKAMRAFSEIDAGGVLVNQAPTFRLENMPYGGVKDSGFGREGIRYAMEEMSEPRSLILKLA